MEPKEVANKTAVIKSFDTSAHSESGLAVFRGFVNCLSTNEACDLLLESTAPAEYNLRDALLRKITADIRRRFLPNHKKLIEQLISLSETHNAIGRQGIGVCLTSLANCSPVNLQRRIAIVFIQSKFITFRRRGYKIASTQWSKNYLVHVLRAWEIYKDFEFTRLVIEHASYSFIFSHEDELVEIAKGTWLLSRIYLRLGLRDKKALLRLRYRDAISYTYVVTKLGEKLPNSAALKIFDDYKFDDRLGLLIWCFGQQRLWNVLTTIAARLELLANERNELVLKKFGVTKIVIEKS